MQVFTQLARNAQSGAFDFKFGAFWMSAFLLSLSGCSHAPLAPEMKETPQALFGFACHTGLGIQTVKGAVWMKVQSKEASGQFPASIEAHAPDQLKLEATNLIGSTQALIEVKGHEYRVDVPSKTSKTGMRRQEQGKDSWGGIPLRWATDLFLGKIPCPTGNDPTVEKTAEFDLSLTESGDLRVQTHPKAYSGAEIFIYHFRSWEGHPWPEALRWEQKGVFSSQVDFKFDDPEGKTRSPGKWEAKSPQGEVKVRWRDRQIN